MGRNQRDETTVISGSETAGGQSLQIEDACFVSNATANVTISNVAPAAVGTATISKWLSFRDNAGTVYFIPAWT